MSDCCFPLTGVVNAGDSGASSVSVHLDAETVVGVGDRIASDVDIADSDIA